MNSDITGIDHLMLAVEDSASAGEIFARMGFTITPRGQLPGMSNRLICFANSRENVPNFVELMSLDDPAKAPPAMAAALKIPNRPVLLVAASADAKVTRDRLASGGIATSPVIDGERDWTLPDGEVLDLAFSIVLPAGGHAPFYWIACQHKTPQHYLRADFTGHDNGAAELSKIISVAQDPLAAGKHYEQLWAATIVDATANGGPIVVKRGRVLLHIHSRETFGRTFPGIALQRSDDHIVGFATRVPKTKTMYETLNNNGFDPMKIGSAIVVAPSHCCGCMVVFETAETKIS